jgi:hypothetical protein
MTTNLFVIANVKQLRTGSFRILLPFFRTCWGVGVLNSAIFKLIKILDWDLCISVGRADATPQFYSVAPSKFDQWRTEGGGLGVQRPPPPANWGPVTPVRHWVWLQNTQYARYFPS